MCPQRWEYCDVTWPECTKCKAGTYRSQMDQESCLLCEPGTFSPTPGATSCQKCPANHYAPTEGSKTCMVCPAGTIGTVEGGTDKSVCKPCEANEIADTLAGRCVPCPHNTFPHDGKCKACPAGHVRKSDSVSGCQACPAGHQPRLILHGESGNAQRDYRGTVSMTKDKATCLSWMKAPEKNRPNTKPLGGLGDHNYCR